MKRLPNRDDWQSQRARKMEEFVEHWDWESVASTWTRQLKDAKALISPLFTTIKVHDPKNPVGRSSQLSWWPTDELQTLQKELQHWLYRHPGTQGDIHGHGAFGSGELQTLERLYEVRDDTQKIGALLISASIFSRLGSARGRFPEKWPPQFCVDVVAGWAHRCLGWRSERDGWHYACTSVLPYKSDDWQYQIDAMDGLIRYLSDEHVGLLYRYRPVVIEFVGVPDPFIKKLVEQEVRAEAQKHEAWVEQRKRIDAEEAEQSRLLREKHPRYGEWARISKEELLRLVWTKPAIEIANDFGVSDVAIGKRCKALGISKPAAGFWAKVAAGKVAHPRGAEPRDSAA